MAKTSTSHSRTTRGTKRRAQPQQERIVEERLPHTVIISKTIDDTIRRFDGDYLTDDELNDVEKSKPLRVILIEDGNTSSNGSEIGNVQARDGETLSWSQFLEQMEQNISEYWRLTAQMIQLNELIQIHEYVTQKQSFSSYNIIRLMRSFFHGCFNVRLNQQQRQETSEYNLEVNGFRRKFLKFLFKLWCRVVPNLDPVLPRTIQLVRSLLSPSDLYLLAVDHFGQTLRRCIFNNKVVIKLENFPRELELPPGKYFTDTARDNIDSRVRKRKSYERLKNGEGDDSSESLPALKVSKKAVSKKAEIITAVEPSAWTEFRNNGGYQKHLAELIVAPVVETNKLTTWFNVILNK